MNDHIVQTISVFGLGYVGCVSVASLSKAGFHIIGVEPNLTKVDLINRGIPTIVEPGLDELMMSGKIANRIEATTDSEAAILKSDIVLITVGTPSLENGELDLSNVFSVAKSIGLSLKNKNKYLTVAIRSTIKPGTCDKVIQIIEEVSGKERDVDFSVVANPEFLREGSAIFDYENPPYVLIGSNETKGANIMASIYANLNAEVLIVDLKTAEILKYVNNTWHALKVAFANEIGSLCKSINIDSHEVMNLFCKDKVLNISSYYLKPGFAFGGACLPKDLSALVALSSSQGVDTPLISNIHNSNVAHVSRAFELIQEKSKGKKVGILGLSFKNKTDDVRNSPIVEISHKLLQSNFELKILDDYVSLALKSDRNARTTRAILGKIENLIVDSPEEIIDFADVIVIAKKDSKYDLILERCKNCTIIDLVYINGVSSFSKNYFGLAW